MNMNINNEKISKLTKHKFVNLTSKNIKNKNADSNKYILTYQQFERPSYFFYSMNQWANHGLRKLKQGPLQRYSSPKAV